jgi:hypothetical protein
MADDYTHPFPLCLGSQRPSMYSVYGDVRPDEKTPVNNVLLPTNADELSSKSNLENPRTHDDFPMEELPKQSPGIQAVMKPSPTISKLTIATSKVSSFNLPSPLSTPHPSESEETCNRVDSPKSLSSSVLFAPADVKVDGEYGRWRNLTGNSDKVVRD